MNIADNEFSGSIINDNSEKGLDHEILEGARIEQVYARIQADNRERESVNESQRRRYVFLQEMFDSLQRF